MDALPTVWAAASPPAASDTTATSALPQVDATRGGGFAAALAQAREHLGRGETLSPVKGHAYGRIDGGRRDGLCVNLSGNERSGRAFQLVVRHGRVFHVYGADGGEKVTVELPRHHHHHASRAAGSGGVAAPGA